MTHLRAVVGQVTPRMPGMPSRSAPRLADWTVFFLFAAQGVRNLVGWPGYIVVACCLLGAIVWSLRGYRNDVRLLLLPPELLAFLLFCASSVLWANYQWVTVIGVLAQWAAAAAGIWLALSLSWDELLAVLTSALVRMLAISLAFEVFVTFAVGQRLAPLWTDYGDEAPGAFYWSENLLLAGGPIQGIPGNRNLLAFAAILALVTVGARIAAGVRGRWPVASIVIALVTLALT
ncbi:MAG: hypothetical protein M3116_05270, partial [Actinomycetota bacterium]|nr:hypothetical protein [Actinomycetota bacterium]